MRIRPVCKTPRTYADHDTKMSNRLESKDERISVTPKSGQTEQLQAVADDRHDGNRAAAMREAFAEYIARYGDDGDASDQIPSDPQLATAYQTLRQRADPSHGRIPTDEAIPAVAEATKLPRAAVKRRVFEPLRERGWIDPRYSVLIVYEQPRGEA